MVCFNENFTLHNVMVTCYLAQALKRSNFQFGKLKAPYSEEFDIDNVPLPEYDPTDMELLLGEELVMMDRFENLTTVEKSMQEKLDEFLKEVESAVKQYDELLTTEKRKYFSSSTSLFFY